MGDELHLRAEDAEDLAVFSSCLQDALVPLADMRYEPDARRFVLAVNRFRWETHPEEETRPEEKGARQAFERIACGIVFEGVRDVQIHGIDRTKRTQLMELLAIIAGETASPATVVLIFAGGGAIRLAADGIRARLDDFGEPWPTSWRPRHQDDHR